MLFITYAGETVALCLAKPDWAQDITVELDLSRSDVATSITALRSPRKFAASSRVSLQYVIEVPATTRQADDAFFSSRLRLWLQRLKGETVGVPLWTDGVEISAGVTAGDVVLAKTPINPVQSGAEWIIVNDDRSVYEIVTVTAIADPPVNTVTLAAGTALNWPAGTLMFPLLFGRVSKRPQFDSETDEVLSGQIGFLENSPYARRLNVYPGAIPQVGVGVSDFSTKPLWNIPPDEETKMLDLTEVDVLYKSVGFSREDSQYVYPQAVRRGLQMYFYPAERAAIAAIARFFVDRYGPIKTFMVPTFRGDLRLTEDLPQSSAAQITVEPSDFNDPGRPTNPGDPYIALVDPAGVDPQKISSIVGNTLQLAGSVATSHSFSDTKLSHLLLCAFSDSKLTLSYKTDAQAECTLKFLELPSEYTAPQADLSEPAYLFQFAEAMPNGSTNYWRYTSYENALALALGGEWDGNYTPAPFDHGESTVGVKLDEEKIDVPSFDFSSTANPLRKLLDYSLEGILHVDILEVDVNNLSGAPNVIFSGDSSALDPSGKDWKATFRAFGQFFQRQFPRFYFQTICNVPLYSAKCTVSRAAFLTDGTLFAFAVDGSYIDIAQIVGHADPAAKPAHYFAIGSFQTGTGLNFEQRMITESVISAGKLRLYFRKPLNKAVLNQTINIYPGCDGSVNSCLNTFDNLLNMRAHPYMPDKNLVTGIGNVNVATGGKK